MHTISYIRKMMLNCLKKNWMMLCVLLIFYQEVMKQRGEIKHTKLSVYYTMCIKEICNFSILQIQY